MILLLCGSTALERTSAASHGRFLNLFRHLVALLWTTVQPITKTSAYTEQHNTEITSTNIYALGGIRIRGLSVQAVKACAPDRRSLGPAIIIITLE
jgi:hypothetical protein